MIFKPKDNYNINTLRPYKFIEFPLKYYIQAGLLLGNDLKRPL